MKKYKKFINIINNYKEKFKKFIHKKTFLCINKNNISLLKKIVEILSIIIGIIGIYFSYKSIYLQKNNPSFSVNSIIITPNDTIYIIGTNKYADKSKNLNVRFGGFLFPNKGILIGRKKWKFFPNLNKNKKLF